MRKPTHKESAKNMPPAPPPKREVARAAPDPDRGLTNHQVKERQEKGWSNTPVEAPTKTAGQIVKENVCTFFNLIFVILAALLVAVGSFEDMLFLFIAIANTGIGILQQLRSKATMDKLNLLAAPRANVVREGNLISVPSAQLVRDDIAEFASGDTLPADGILRSGEMWVDESLLTGEADAVTKVPGDEVKSGSAILSGRGRVQFTAVGGDSFAAQLSREAQKNPGAEKSEMMRSLDRLILFVGIALVPVGIILFYQEFCVLKLGLESSVEGTVAALVGMIPEGLYLLTSIAMAASAVKLSRKKVLVQDMNCIETLARVDVLCVDKTGTITEPDMEVENVVPLSDGNPEYLEAVLTAMYGASEPDNATGKAIHELFGGETDWVCEKRIPFSPETKWSGAVFAGQGAFLVGAPEFILAQRYEEYRDTVDGWAEQGCRVLLAARYDGDPVPGALDPALVTPLALILLSGRIREQAAETFGYFDRQGVTVKVISGDNPHTASLIAARAGIPGADRYIDTSALETDEDFSRAVSENTVFGRVTPEKKRRLVAALQKHTQPVSKITIVPHTSGALGYTMQMPEEEKFLSSREELLVELQTLLGGRAAEQVVFGISTTGAANDIERATDLARKMVTQYGMSEKFGLMALSTVQSQYLDGAATMNCADSTASEVDQEVQKLLSSCFEQAKALLREHRALLDEIALYLLQKETITGDEFMVYVNAENRKLEAPKDEAEASDAEAAPAEDAADKTDENPNPTEGA